MLRILSAESYVIQKKQNKAVETHYNLASFGTGKKGCVQ